MVAVEVRRVEAGVGECDAVVPGELAGDEAGAEATVVVSPEGAGVWSRLGRRRQPGPRSRNGERTSQKDSCA